MLCVFGLLASTNMEGASGLLTFRSKSSPEKTQKVSLVARRLIKILRVPTCPSSWSKARALYAVIKGESKDSSSLLLNSTVNISSYERLRKASTCGKLEYFPPSYLLKK